MEENEVFDSSLLKEQINALIASGKRNFAIDMSPLDYVYSDTINMLMVMNKRVLDVTGRLSLMAPQPEVTQILKRAGIHNILRIFETETELIKSSEDMILQTTGLQPSDVSAALNQGKPQSEFDQLRSEIGSAFGSGESTQSDEVSGIHGHAGTEDDFNQMFHQFETGPQAGRSGYSMPPVQPQAPQPPKFQPRQYSQPAPQPIPLRPAAPAYSPRQPEQPKGMPEFSKMRSETQRFPTAPAAAQFHEPASADLSGREVPPLDDAPSFESPAKIQPQKKPRVHEDFDALDDDDDEFRKKSPLPVVLIAVLVIALIGAGIVIFNTARKKSGQPVATVAKTPAVQQSVTPPAPQVPIETPSEPTTTAMTTPPPEPPKEIVREEPEAAPKPSVRKKSSRPAPVARKSTPRPPKPEPTVNQVIFSSTPSGASVTINDQRMGITPFTWSKPFFGKVNVILSKAGYKNLQKSFEFSGGNMRESYTLEKETVAPPPPPPPVAEPERQSPSRTVASTPPPARKAPAAEVEDDPFADIDAGDDDFSLDSEEPEAPPSPAVRTPPAPSTPRASAPVASSGGEALIFIASIPPVADVYLGTQLLGKTNVSELKIPAGVQTLKFVKGGKEITKQLTLQPGKNPSQMVRIP